MSSWICSGIFVLMIIGIYGSDFPKLQKVAPILWEKSHVNISGYELRTHVAFFKSSCYLFRDLMSSDEYKICEKLYNLRIVDQIEKNLRKEY